MLFLKKETIEKMTPSDHEVIVDWQLHHTTIWWNEICAMVIEVFGLPGNRFVYTPTADFMTFTFKSKKDADLCRLMLSEHL